MRSGRRRPTSRQLNRAVSGIYPPGSTFKPVTALAALQEKMLDPYEPIQCDPSITVDGQKFVNWDPYTNMAMNLVPALERSCDTYFYRVGLRFYERKDSPLQKWARRMGFGSLTGIDVGPEEEGLMPTPAWRRRHFKTEIDKIWTLRRLGAAGDRPGGSPDDTAADDALLCASRERRQAGRAASRPARSRSRRRTSRLPSSSGRSGRSRPAT